MNNIDKEVWYTDATFDPRTCISVLGFSSDDGLAQAYKVVKSKNINEAEVKAIEFFLEIK